MEKDKEVSKLDRLLEIKADIARTKLHVQSSELFKNRYGSLVITNLEQAGHWVSDLIDQYLVAKWEEER